MVFIALLRGVNVGGNRKVEMKKLKKIFEFLDYSNVITYLNSGNIVFESTKKQEVVQNEILKNIENEFGFPIQTLVKSDREIRKINNAIPKEWENNAEQKTDVAFLFPEVDSKIIIDELPIKKEFIDIRYVKGAIIWNVKKKEYNKSHLNKVVGIKLYKQMTVRNVNTVRRLVEISQYL